MIYNLQIKEARLWFLVGYKDFLSIIDISCCVNGDVGICVITHSLIQVSPTSFSDVVCWVKLLLKIAVDCTKRISLEIRCVFDKCVQNIRIAGIKHSIMTNFVDVARWTVLRSNKINSNVRESVKGLCFIFNGSFWIAKECWS